MVKNKEFFLLLWAGAHLITMTYKTFLHKNPDRKWLDASNIVDSAKDPKESHMNLKGFALYHFFANLTTIMLLFLLEPNKQIYIAVSILSIAANLTEIYHCMLIGYLKVTYKHIEKSNPNSASDINNRVESSKNHYIDPEKIMLSGIIMSFLVSTIFLCCDAYCLTKQKNPLELLLNP